MGVVMRSSTTCTSDIINQRSDSERTRVQSRALIVHLFPLVLLLLAHAVQCTFISYLDDIK